MSLTREQVADLQPGDIVEMSWTEKDATVSIRGPLTAGRGELLLLGSYWVREVDGSPIQALQKAGRRTLTVVSRAPRPLYVNHPRTEPVRGDVARDAGSDNPARCWVYDGATWHWTEYPAEVAGDLERVRLRLLVDGTTGQVVQ